MTNLLLDTHAFIWYSEDDSKLPESIKTEIETADRVCISVASLWEIAIKLSIGKLSLRSNYESIETSLEPAGISLLPISFADTVQVNVFGGSAAVIINRPPSPVETYNDIHSEVVNFFRVLRDQKEPLIEAIGLTPFSREELALASQRQTEGITELERARRFFVCARQVRTGLAQTSSAGRWAHCLLTSRAGMSGAVSRWLGSIDDLSLIAQRLLRVQIENAPAIDVIRRYDSADTLFYCDPPYPHGARGDSKAYAHEMTDTDHRELASVLRNVQGKVALSSYHCDLMDELYSDWYIVEAPAKMCHSVKSARTEVLWMNYEPPKETEWTHHQKSSQSHSKEPTLT